MREPNLFEELQRTASRPKPFEVYTAETLWDDEHISAQMLEYHLSADVNLASRKGAFIDASTDWIVSRFALGEGVAVADFGCGPGLYASRFAERGAAVTGIDFSRRSIRYARDQASKLGHSIDYRNENYLEFETDARFDLITMIFCDLCALSPAQRATLLGKFQELLKDDGAVLLDVCSLKAFEKWKESSAFERRMMNGFWSPEDYYGLRVSFKYEERKVTLDKYTIVEPHRRWEIYNWLQYFSPDSLASEFKRAGFRIEETCADVAGGAYDERGDQFAVVAVRGVAAV